MKYEMLPLSQVKVGPTNNNNMRNTMTTMIPMTYPGYDPAITGPSNNTKKRSLEDKDVDVWPIKK
jgi:hypothetical protein